MEDRSAMRHVCLFCWSYLVLSNRVRLVFVSRLLKYVLCTRRDILRKILRYKVAIFREETDI